MEFKLFYEGNLKSNSDKNEKNKIRHFFNKQLKILWNQMPLNEYRSYLAYPPEQNTISIITNIGNNWYAPLISNKIYLIADLDILLLQQGIMDPKTWTV